jgi:trehalose 6-phosphate phosphatase
MTGIVPGLPAPPSELAFLLDIDGTILDIAATPGEVRVDEGLRDTLVRLDRLSGNALALVSGRSLQDIDRVFAPLRLAAIGGHGAELRVAKGEAPIPGRAPALPSGLRQRFAAIAGLGTGIIVEDKGYSIALHYRLAPDLKEAIENAVAAIHAEQSNDTLDVLLGKAVIEIKRRGFEKGTGVRELMQHRPFAGRRPIFVGDDVTDASVFAVLPEFGGIGFSVGRMFAGAAHCFTAPTDVRRWLARISGLEAVATS